jgi:hypothetical protein
MHVDLPLSECLTNAAISQGLISNGTFFKTLLPRVEYFNDPL